jgi:predicted hotdog family 3-hydroxylacyl-ACP dehydratase
MTQYPAIEDLVPHSGGMRLLDAMTHWTRGEAHCCARVRGQGPFVRAGRAESAAMIEYMAQAVAACLGYEAMLDGGAVRIGMVIACKRFDAHVAQLCAGDELCVQVRCIQGNDTLSQFDCKVERAGKLLGSAVLTLYHAPSLPGAS